MLDRLAELPFWQAFTALFAIVMLRSNATYWVGRGAIAGWRRRRGAGDIGDVGDVGDVGGDGDVRGARTAQTERGARASALLRRLGPVAVTVSYLTVGIQTAVHLGAGAMRMPLRLYLPASTLGSLAWAGLYATVGLAVVQAWVAAEAGSWYGLGAILALALVAVATWLVTRHRARPLG